MIGIAPVLGWLYTPDTFGHLAYFMFAFQMLTSVSIFRFDWLLPNAKTSTEELGLMALGALALLSISAASALAVVFPPAVFSNWVGYSALGHLFMLLPFAAIGMGIRLLLNARHVRSGDLTAVSRVKVTETLGNAGASVALGLAGLIASGLILARALSSWIGILHLLRTAPITRNQVARVTTRRLSCILKRHWWSATRSTIVSFTNTLSTNAHILVLSRVAETSELGLFFMATRIILTPIQLGAQALSQSFWSRSAELARNRRYFEMRQEYLALLLRLSLVALASAAALLGIGVFIEEVFPPRWNGLGATFMAVTPMILGTITIGSTNHLVVFDKPQLQLIADATRLLLMVVSVLALAKIGMPFWTLVLAVSLASLTGHVILFGMHLIVYNKAVTGKLART